MNHKTFKHLDNGEVDFKVSPEEQRMALFNILEDTNEDRKFLQDQQTAVFNVLEDLNEQQEKLKTTRKQFQDLTATLVALSKKSSVKGALDFLALSLNSIAHFKKVAILTPDEFENLKCTSSSGFPKDWPLDKFTISIQDRTNALVHAYLEGKFIAVDNVRAPGINLSMEVVEMFTLTSFLLIPFSMGAGQKAMVIADRGELLPFSAEEGAIFQTYTSQAASALTQINLLTILENQKHKLQELDKMKTEFLSVASHQLRTPLGSMRWNMEMLLGGDMGKISNEVEENIRQTYESNQRMIILVNDLLNVSRIEQGRVKDNPQPTQVEDIIKQVVKEIKLLAKEKEVRLNYSRVEKNLPKINIDPKRFHEVITNLVSNAIKYNKKKGNVDVVLAEIDHKFSVVIADTGMGIPKKEHERVFSKFFRSEKAVKSETEGSGMGLFVVKSYVEGWGGKVWFESEEGKGTTFFVELPLKPKTHTLDKNLAEQAHALK